MRTKKGELTIAAILLAIVFTLAIGALVEPAFTGRVTENATEEVKKGKKK